MSNLACERRRVSGASAVTAWVNRWFGGGCVVVACVVRGGWLEVVDLCVDYVRLAYVSRIKDRSWFKKKWKPVGRTGNTRRARNRTRPLRIFDEAARYKIKRDYVMCDCKVSKLCEQVYTIPHFKRKPCKKKQKNHQTPEPIQQTNHMPSRRTSTMENRDTGVPTRHRNERVQKGKDRGGQNEEQN